MAANRPWRTLRELQRQTGCIVAKCRCGRAAVFSTIKLAELFVRMKWDGSWAEVPGRLKCDRKGGGCGRHAPEVTFVPGW